MNQPAQSGFLGHPKGLRTLFFMEFWERFSYYGMRALLVLFMTAAIETGGLGWTAEKAGLVYGMYGALVYFASMPGGWLADRVIGQRRAVFVGGCIIMAGHLALAIPGEGTFFLGLGLVIVGTGLLKPNISTMVGGLYTPADSRRDAGFSLFYMGINLGAMLAPFVTGWLAQGEGFKAMLAGWGMAGMSTWHWGFGAAAVGMFFGLIWYLVDRRSLGDVGQEPAPASREEEAQIRRTLWTALGGTALIAAALYGAKAVGLISLSTPQEISQAFSVGLVLIVVGFFTWLFFGATWTPEERSRLVVILVLFVGATIFWSVFEQSGSTLSLFAQRSTRNELFGQSFPPAWWQSVNAMMIVTLAGFFAWFWARLGSRDPSSPAKFSLGLLLVGLSFIWMVPAAKLTHDGTLVGWWWLAGCFLLQSLGELCLSPVGLSAMTKLAPARVASLMMGVWFMATAVGTFIGGKVASKYETFSLPDIFGAVGASAVVAGILMALMVKPIKRMLTSAS